MNSLHNSGSCVGVVIYLRPVRCNPAHERMPTCCEHSLTLTLTPSFFLCWGCLVCGSHRCSLLFECNPPCWPRLLLSQP